MLKELLEDLKNLRDLYRALLAQSAERMERDGIAVPREIQEALK